MNTSFMKVDSNKIFDWYSLVAQECKRFQTLSSLPALNEEKESSTEEELEVGSSCSMNTCVVVPRSLLTNFIS